MQSLKLGIVGNSRRAREILAVANRAKRRSEMDSRLNRWHAIRLSVLSLNVSYAEIANKVGNGCNRKIVEKWINDRTTPIIKHLDALELIVQGNN